MSRNSAAARPESCRDLLVVIIKPVYDDFRTRRYHSHNSLTCLAV